MLNSCTDIQEFFAIKCFKFQDSCISIHDMNYNENENFKRF